MFFDGLSIISLGDFQSLFPSPVFPIAEKPCNDPIVPIQADKPTRGLVIDPTDSFHGYICTSIEISMVHFQSNYTMLASVLESPNTTAGARPSRSTP
jgi:hypothetical protein